MQDLKNDEKWTTVPAHKFKEMEDELNRLRADADKNIHTFRLRVYDDSLRYRTSQSLGDKDGYVRRIDYNAPGEDVMFDIKRFVTEVEYYIFDKITRVVGENKSLLVKLDEKDKYISDKIREWKDLFEEVEKLPRWVKWFIKTEKKNEQV